ncbi:unnamed protein product [Vitrella brassicaformis CCMP3155]|uniref:Uncharacterized protein n=1 Tax=Vitrella brassicaformis (strain CCMP3155) TaxID=1169540 RepID=A0A0G4EZB7_VITBC|nr:unnamed protein product [Vitrella brassicaformis CCMP3155]|eukprot:CEM04658.1 unnamed protein product [Vitrella brassicaformis CCMP3155]
MPVAEAIVAAQVILCFPSVAFACWAGIQLFVEAWIPETDVVSPRPRSTTDGQPKTREGRADELPEADPVESREDVGTTDPNSTGHETLQGTADSGTEQELQAEKAEVAKLQKDKEYLKEQVRFIVYLRRKARRYKSRSRAVHNAIDKLAGVALSCFWTPPSSSSGQSSGWVNPDGWKGNGVPRNMLPRFFKAAAKDKTAMGSLLAKVLSAVNAGVAAAEKAAAAEAAAEAAAGEAAGGGSSEIQSEVHGGSDDSPLLVQQQEPIVASGFGAVADRDGPSSFSMMGMEHDNEPVVSEGLNRSPTMQSLTFSSTRSSLSTASSEGRQQSGLRRTSKVMHNLSGAAQSSSSLSPPDTD